MGSTRLRRRSGDEVTNSDAVLHSRRIFPPHTRPATRGLSCVDALLARSGSSRAGDQAWRDKRRDGSRRASTRSSRREHERRAVHPCAPSQCTRPAGRGGRVAFRTDYLPNVIGHRTDVRLRFTQLYDPSSPAAPSRTSPTDTGWSDRHMRLVPQRLAAANKYRGIPTSSDTVEAG